MGFFTGFQKIAKSICTPASELVEEHEHLVKVLRRNKRSEEKKEEKKQSKELKDYKKQVGVPKGLNSRERFIHSRN